MWPGSGSGFEADPSSPAGQLQGEARFLEGMSGDPRRAGRAVLWAAVGVVAIMVVVFGSAWLLHH